MYLRIVLIILSGSLYASIVGLIYWGSTELMGVNTILGLSLGAFTFSVVTISVVSLVMAIASRVNNGN
jgi:hypothetical protein